MVASETAFKAMRTQAIPHLPQNLWAEMHLRQEEAAFAPEATGALIPSTPLKTPPSDLTTLGKGHAGKFPEDYVAESRDLASFFKLTVHRTCPSGVLSSVLVTNLMKWL
jgi:hypothetical protein